MSDIKAEPDGADTPSRPLTNLSDGSAPKMAGPSDTQSRPIVTYLEAKALGLKRYFTGKPCKRGHISERYLSNACVECLKYDPNRPPRKAGESARKAREFKTKARADAKECGLKRYYTGLPCVHGHIAEWYVSGGLCVECVAANKKRYPEDPEVKRARDRKYRAEHPDRVRANIERLRAKHPTSAPAVSARRHRRWRTANPEKVRAIRHNRRARELNAGGMHTGADIALLMKKHGGKCAHAWCRISLKAGYHVDHIMPLARGGSNDRRNLQLLCQPCNNRKHAAHPIDFAQKNGMLL